MKYYDISMKILSVFLLFLLVVDISIQVFARYFLPYAPSWTEEAARFILLYLVAISSGLALEQKMFVNVDILLHIKRFSPLIAKILTSIASIVIFISSVVILVSAFPLIEIGKNQVSAALLLPMNIVFIIMLILPANIIVVQIYQVIKNLRKN